MPAPQLSPTPALADAAPGPSADPSRIYVSVTGSGAGAVAVLCNASRADRGFCVWARADGTFVYGKAEGTIATAARSLLAGEVWWW